MFSTTKLPFGKVASNVLNTVRFASKKAKKSTSKKIKRYDVQLLKSHPQLGVKGQIISVKSGYMRQTLYPNKYAAYTFNGPKIPVVEPTTPIEPVEVNEEITTSTPQQKEEPIGGLSSDELSKLFGSLKKKDAKSTEPITIDSETVEDVPYTASEIRELITSNATITSSEFPVTKDHLVEHAHSLSGISIPATQMKIRTIANTQLEQIREPGQYIWTIKTPDNIDVKISLTIKD